MQMLYNSDSFVVVQFDLPAQAPTDGGDGVVTDRLGLGRGGFEIVDKAARKEIYIEGLLAESFKTGVQAIANSDPSPEAYDAFIGRYTALAQQPLIAH